MNLKNLQPEIIREILEALDGIDYGSVEIVVQDGEVTQFSTRSIKKTRISKHKRDSVAL